jgi:hypothetical protein
MLKGRSEKRVRSLWGEIIAILIIAGLGVLFILGIKAFAGWFMVNYLLFWTCVMFSIPTLIGAVIYMYHKKKFRQMEDVTFLSIIILMVTIMIVISHYLW